MELNQQIKMIPIICNRADHQGGIILGLCLRVGCQNLSALCFRCTLQLHQNCNASTKMMEDVPNLLQPLLKKKIELIQLLQQINSQISKLVSSIEYALVPIRQYTENPNITNLNNLGDFLKTKVQVIQLSEIEKTEQAIKAVFDEVRAKVSQVTQQSSQEKISRKTCQKLILAGNALYDLKNFEQAFEYSEQALKIYQKNTEALILKALKCSEEAIQVDSQNFDAWILKGNALYGLYNYQQALQCSEKALTINQKSPEAFILQGNALFGLGKYQQALEDYEQALKIDLLNSDSWVLKGTALVGLYDYKLALECFQQALKIDSENREALRLYNSTKSYLQK